MTTAVNGHANGTTWPSLTWPQQDDPGQSRRTTPDSPGREAVDGDKVIRWLTAAVVLAVAAFAAVVSYSHIFELGSHHGQDGTAARLLPLSVDGLIAAASLVMLHAARNKLPVPSLARFMLALGVAATVAANVEYGLPFGWLAAVVSAWPAVAFVGSVEMAVRFVRDARAVATPATCDTTDDAKDDSGDNKDDTPPRELAAGLPATTPPVMSGDGSAPTRRSRPKLTVEAEAARDKVSVRTVQRRRAKNRTRT